MLTKVTRLSSLVVARLLHLLLLFCFVFEKLVSLPDFPGGSAVKNQPVMKETQVPSLGREDPLEKEMATHSIILAWSSMGNPMDKGAWQASVHGVTKSGT